VGVTCWFFAQFADLPWPVLAGVALVLVLVLVRRLRAAARSTRVGPYTLHEKLGEGGMGVVYKASHARLARPAAIKLLAPGRSGERDTRRFEREVQLTSRLTHPNSIAIYDFGRTDDGTFYYAMEYIDGVDLQTLVERDGPLAPARVAHILAQLAAALVEAHQSGLVHRDVKPANIMLCERGNSSDFVKLLDFGLIKEVSAPGDLTHTDPQQIIGTPLYISPEALTTPDSIDGRSDLYALGAVGYFLLTGEPPFSGRTAIEVCGHHLHTQPLRLSERGCAGIPAGLEALLLSCLAKSPAERPPSAAWLQRALQAYATDSSPMAASPWNPELTGVGHAGGELSGAAGGAARRLSADSALAA
jgi:serine/threonine-protein kinase